MIVKTIRQPGQKGTQKLLEKYGERLVCVRYRYDAFKGKRYKTVELIIAQSDWEPPPPREEYPAYEPPQYTPMVAVRIGPFERDLQQGIKAIGGHWHPDKKLWYAPKEYVVRIGLQDRIVKGY